jgi:hypothetical protein
VPGLATRIPPPNRLEALEVIESSTSAGDSAVRSPRGKEKLSRLGGTSIPLHPEGRHLPISLNPNFGRRSYSLPSDAMI